MTKDRSVNFPPIIDVMIMIVFDHKFSSEETALVCTKLRGIGFEKDRARNFHFKVTNNERVEKEISTENIALETADQEHEVVIGNDAIIYRDGRKYKNRQVLYERFSQIWNECELEKHISKIREVRLRAINKFIVAPKDMGTKIKIYPNISLDNEEPILGPVDLKIHLRSEYRDANAEVGLTVIPRESDSVELVFDIDTYVKKESFLDFKSIVAILNRLSDFRNDIFYGNIIDAKERFEHDPTSA